jgi:hypothetical protein
MMVLAMFVGIVMAVFLYFWAIGTAFYAVRDLFRRLKKHEDRHGMRKLRP